VISPSRDVPLVKAGHAIGSISAATAPQTLSTLSTDYTTIIVWTLSFKVTFFGVENETRKKN
jgi:hypothetical protein